MTEESFNMLVDDLGPYLCVDEVKSRNSTSGIQPVENHVALVGRARSYVLGGCISHLLFKNLIR
jgi:hypothetical protein